MQPSTNKGLDSDNSLFQSILFSVRSTERLTSVQLHYLYLCSSEQLIQIIEMYNDLIDNLINYIMLDD
jgi:hypothetical protein